MNDFTLALGHAGTGKTYCAVGMALKCLLNPQSDVKKIVVIRRAIAACEDSIGHLPGDAFDKMLPYFGSILDNLEEFIDRRTLRFLIRDEKIEIVPLAFLRGRTLKNCFIIVEEAQNNSVEAMKMILTRVGHGSKIVVTGDVNQRDDRDRVSGLVDASTRFADCPGFGIIHLYAEEDVVRNEQTNRIIERYEQDME
jgi:phosphate starvation-inducible PhoH-like protein